MKDIIARITSAEKNLITELRNLNVFEFKDLVNELQKLLLLSKVTDEAYDFNHINNLIELLKDLMKEREDEALKKLERKKSRSSSKKSPKSLSSKDQKKQESSSKDNTSKQRIVSEKSKDSGNKAEAVPTPAAPQANNKNTSTKDVTTENKPAIELEQTNSKNTNTPLLEKLKARKFKNFFTASINEENDQNKKKE